MTSFRKKAANKKNAAKSTGPKTETGKRSVSLNALRHGFYSHELTVLEPDKRDYETLRESLLAELAPRTALQAVGFQQIVTCCWRCKLAIRLEMHRLNLQFTANNESTSDETAPQRDVRKTQWYGASRQSLRDGIRFLQELRDVISESGALHLEERKNEIIKAFGVGFYDGLAEWKDMNITAMHLAEFLQKHEENFNLPLPASSKPPEGVETLSDPKQKLQMLVKLVDLQAQHLSDLNRINLAASRETAPNEFAPRYFGTASRDLQRAVDWYVYLRSNNL